MTMQRLPVGWIVFTAAVVLRLTWILVGWLNVGPTLVYPDEVLHWNLADNLVHHGALVSDDGRYAARMPAYPLFLAAFAWLDGVGILVVRIAQALLSAGAVVVGYQLALRAVGQRGALLAGLLLTFNPYDVFFCRLLLTEALFTPVAVGLVAASWHVLATDASRWRPLAVVAALGALAVMTRPSAAAWIPLVWLLLVVLATNRRRTALRLVIAPVLLLLCMVPWGLRNLAVLGHPAWLSANGGLTLYDAQGPQADGSSDQSFLQDPAIQARLADLGEVERDQLLQRLALQQMRRDPIRVVSLAFTKFTRTWNPWPNVPAHRNTLAGHAGAAYTIIVVLTALLGLLRTTVPPRSGGAPQQSTPRCKDSSGVPLLLSSASVRRLHALIWLAVLYFTLLHMIYIGSVRYRVPLMPLLAIAAGTAVLDPRPAAPHSVVRLAEGQLYLKR